MSSKNKPQLGTLHRRIVSLLTALTFLVLAVTGVLAFVRPFTIGITGLHALVGFVFIALIILHVINNSRPLASYLHSKSLWTTLAATTAVTMLFWRQPAPVKTVLGWSGNLGPAMERFEMRDEGMVFNYAPSPDYKMRVTVKPGPSFHTTPPPQVAIWLENHGGYHIKTLLAPADGGMLPYWSFKHAGWEKARRDARNNGAIDGITSATPNGSFDPADYILPAASKHSKSYQLLLEIDQPGDKQPSLVYAVEIDNSLPRTYQLLEMRGYPKQGDDDKAGGATWNLHYIDPSIGSALDLIDSALLTIERAW